MPAIGGLLRYDEWRVSLASPCRSFRGPPDVSPSTSTPFRRGELRPDTMGKHDRRNRAPDAKRSSTSPTRFRRLRNETMAISESRLSRFTSSPVVGGRSRTGRAFLQRGRARLKEYRRPLSHVQVASDLDPSTGGLLGHSRSGARNQVLAPERRGVSSKRALARDSVSTDRALLPPQ